MQLFNHMGGMLEFLVGYAFVVYALAAALRSKTLPFIRMSTTCAMFCYAMLAALATRHCTFWTDMHYFLVIAILPILSYYSAGHHLFQLANVFGIYKAINSGNFKAIYDVPCIALHLCLLFASADKNTLLILANIKDIVLCTEERRLLGIQKTRNIDFSDIKMLPERMRLSELASKFIYNVKRSFFVMRTIIELTWRLIVVIYILTTITRTLYFAETLTESHIMKCIDNFSQYAWYHGYVFVLGHFALNVIESQLDRVKPFLRNELVRVVDALRLHLFRLPLLNTGLHKEHLLIKIQTNVKRLFHSLKYTQYVVAKLATMFADFAVLYAFVGWLALIPIGITLIYKLFENTLEYFFGSHQSWIHEWYKHDDRVAEIFHNIKSIKMFGWEKYYIDPKIQQYWERFNSKKRIPWYAPLAILLWEIFTIFQATTDKWASFILFYFYLQGKSGEQFQTMTIPDIIWMNNLCRQMQGNTDFIMSNISVFWWFVEDNYNIEKALRGNYVNTLTRYPASNDAVPNDDSKVLEDCSKPKIHVSNGEFVWHSDEPVLKNMTFSIEQGELVMVTGKTGSGKSTLLLSLCGEVEMSKGTGAVVGSLALVEQRPWIMSGTLRDNILFGRDYDKDFYNKVTHACALTEDIKNWANKDLTMIGERGFNISVGQKARLALARAVYSRADIYILDDPLSAVDAQVMRHILDHVIMDSGLLAGRIRIMSSNIRNLQPYFDKVLLLDKNKNVSVIPNRRQEYKSFSYKRAYLLEDHYTSSFAKSDYSNDDSSLSDTSEASESKDNADEHHIAVSTKGWSNWSHIKFILRVCGLPILAAILIPALLLSGSQFIFDGHKIDLLRNNSNADNVTKSVIQQYLMIEVLTMCSEAMISSFEHGIYGYMAKAFITPRIQSMFIKQVVHAPLAYYDSKNRQEISYAYNEGAEALSKKIPYEIKKKLSQVLSIILTIYRIGTSAPQLLLLVPVCIWMNRQYNAIGVPVRLSLEKIRSKLSIEQDKVEDTIEDGKRIIRIFNVEKHFTEKYVRNNDNELRVQILDQLFAGFPNIFYNMWYYLLFGLYYIFVMIQKQIFESQITSFEFMITISMIKMLVSNIDDIMDIEIEGLYFKDKIEAFRQYMDIHGEKMFVENALTPEKQWPSAGKIELRNFNMRYHEDLELVLKNINLTIEPGEKIGIVGRTGAGKTSLTRALFRLIDSKNCTGSIVIDGHDISSFNLGDLRPKLGIIPQEPTMFKGSFRQNLDPLVEHNIENMWSAIVKCGIVRKVQPQRSNRFENEDKDDIYIDEDILEEIKDWDEDWKKASWPMRMFLYAFITRPRINKGIIAKNRNVRRRGLDRHAGDSFSEGQQQLFGLCRLLMRNRKIVVLDEATASVDLETDKQVHELIQSEFKDCTVLTIAHRLETIMRSNRIIVMDNGKIVEVGPPFELLTKNGHFVQLVKANDFGQ